MVPEKLSKEESRKVVDETDARLNAFNDWLVNQGSESEPMAKPERAIVKTFILWTRFYENGDEER